MVKLAGACVNTVAVSTATLAQTINTRRMDPP
jgi:hypothetical protein